MTAPDKHERRFPTLAIVLCVVFGLPVLYVLSSGPVMWLEQRGYLPQHTLDFAFAPLKWLYDHSGAVRSALDSYFDLWQ